MDISIIQKQYEQPTEYPSSIALQNHIYGCFILMEDIAQGVITYDGTIVKGISNNESYILPIDKVFDQIGIRYGFILDTKLVLEDCLPAYKSMWLSIFKTLSASKKIEDVDAIEDIVITWIQKTIVAEDAYFIHALEKGILPQAWIGKVVGLLLPTSPLSYAKVDVPVMHSVVQSAVPSAVPSDVPSAVPVTIKSRHFARTRRHHATQSILKKNFGQTRRSIGLNTVHNVNRVNTIIQL
jgi:hypothetical protein